MDETKLPAGMPTAREVALPLGSGAHGIIELQEAIEARDATWAADRGRYRGALELIREALADRLTAVAAPGLFLAHIERIAANALDAAAQPPKVGTL